MKTWKTWMLSILQAIVVISIATSIIIGVSVNNSRDVESHIDNTIAVTVQKAEAEANNAQAQEIKNLTSALENQAVPAIVQECKIIESLGGKCPTVTVEVQP